jgi:hypothetical protein
VQSSASASARPSGSAWHLSRRLGLGSFSLPDGQLAIWLVIAAVAGLIASIGLCRKVARLNVLEAISCE